MKKIYLMGVLLLLAACQTLPTSSEWLMRGNGYFKDGKMDKAVQAYTRAEQLNSKRADVYNARGAAYFFNGQYALAQADFIKSLQLNPYQADAYTALSSALAAQGDFQNALQLINQSITLNPSKPETYFTRGGINFMLEQYEQAVYDYSMVLNIRPAADVYNARGAAYLKLGKTAQAKADFEKAQEQGMPAKLNDYTMVD